MSNTVLDLIKQIIVILANEITAICNQPFSFKRYLLEFPVVAIFLLAISLLSVSLFVLFITYKFKERFLNNLALASK